MEKRRSTRTKHRLTCELLVGPQRFPAVVRDLAPTGLFVQTRARPPANSVALLRFPAMAGQAGFQIEVGIARQRNVHPRLQSEIHAGVGLEILGRPAEYRAFAERVMAEGGLRTTRPAEPTFVEDDEGGERSERFSYRVRLVAAGHGAPRTITVQAPSAGAARAQATALYGPGWKISDVQMI